MTLYERFKNIAGSNISAFLEKYENPMKDLDYAYEKLQEEAKKVKQGITDLTTAKNKLEQHKTKLCQSLFTLDDQAKVLMEQGNEPLARQVITQKVEAEGQIGTLGNQIKSLKENLINLTKKDQQLTLEIQQFQAKKEVMKAKYAAAKAQKDINESLTGLGNNNSGAEAIKRADDKTNSMQARADAMDELQDTGVLTNSVSGESSIDRDIRNSKTKSEVDKQIAAMKNRK